MSWFAVLAPANTPAPIIEKLLEIGLDPVGGTPAELAAYQKSEITKWAKVVKDSGATAD